MHVSLSDNNRIDWMYDENKTEIMEVVATHFIGIADSIIEYINDAHGMSQCFRWFGI